MKPCHTIILDSGPIITGEPSISTLLQQCEEILTIPAVLSEIKDAQTRSRLETTLKPFLKLREPKASSVKFVLEFARKTGDLVVLSRTDLLVIALGYEVECERNGGDWRLRNEPGQKRTNGPAPAPAAVVATSESESGPESGSAPAVEADEEQKALEGEQKEVEKPIDSAEQQGSEQETAESDQLAQPVQELDTKLEQLSIGSESDDTDSEGWITPSNIDKKQLQDDNANTALDASKGTMQVAIITTDYAMQNVILQINLNLISPSLQRVQHIKTTMLRCHACFLLLKNTQDPSQPRPDFCPRCGQPTLIRVTTTTHRSTGKTQIHLKKNMQWNNRGNRYSIPKPTGGGNGSAGAGSGGKTNKGLAKELILAGDQLEYTRKLDREKRDRARLDKLQQVHGDDGLLGFMMGRKSGGHSGKIRIGAGRDVNARKR